MKTRVLAVLLAIFAASQSLAGLRMVMETPVAMSGTGATIAADFVGNDQVLVTVKPTDPAVAHYGIIIGFNPDEYQFVQAKGASVFLVENGRAVLASSYVFNGPNADAVGIVLRKTSPEWGQLEPQGLDMFTRNRERRIYEPAPAFTPKPEVLPQKLTLWQNYPNPFNPETKIRFKMSSEGAVELAIYNVAGQKVRTLVSDPLAAGEHIATWDATDDAGRPISAGVYLCRLRWDGQTATQKMFLAK